MPIDPLESVLESAGVESSRLQRAELQAISRKVSKVPADEFIEAVTCAPGLSWDDGQTRPAGYLEIHDRHWWIEVTDARNRQYLLTVIAAAVLADALKLHFSILWITRVLPEVLMVRSARRDDTGLHLDLTHRTAPQRLPPHLADIVNPDDYAEFVAAVEGAAAVLPTPAGGTVTFTRYAR